MNKKITLALSAFIIGLSFVGAYTSIDGTTNDRNTDGLIKDVDPETTSNCLLLNSTGIRLGARDTTTGGEVSLLQDFLVSNGSLRTQVTGIFGINTFNAVKMFQRKSGIAPSGYVGAMTRAKIKEATCSAGQESQDGGSGNQSGKTPDTMMGRGSFQACTMEAKLCPNGSMMKRDMTTCKWIESSCGQGGNSLNNPTNSSSTEPRFIMQCLYAAPPVGCNYIPGPYYKAGSNCGMVLSCGGSDSGAGKDLPPSSGITKPKICPIEMTLVAMVCPNGTPMKRDPMTCQWLPCDQAASTTPIRYQYDPLPPKKPMIQGTLPPVPAY